MIILSIEMTFGYMLPINDYYTREGIFSKVDSFNNLLIDKVQWIKIYYES